MPRNHESTITIDPLLVECPVATHTRPGAEYFDWKLLSHNTTYNFIVGPRGMGKMYWARKRVSIALRKLLESKEAAVRAAL